jgi:hypothetical protein
MPQPVSLERYAELTARMTSGEKRDEVLKSVDLDLETWEMSQQYWLGKMATEAGRDRYSLAQRYGLLFKTAQARLLGLPMKLQRYPQRNKQKAVIVHAIPTAPASAGPPSPRPPPSVPLPGSPAAPPSAPAPPAPAPSTPAVVPPPASLGAAPLPPPPVGNYTARLTLEQLAAMRAEIALAAEADQPGVMQRFGLDRAGWEQEESHWQRRLAGDQNLFKQYLRQFQYCRSLLQRR